MPSMTRIITPLARGLCPPNAEADAPGGSLTRGRGRETRLQEKGGQDRTSADRAHGASWLGGATHAAESLGDAGRTASRMGWPGRSGVGFAGWRWGRGPQPKRGRFFPIDEFEDGRPLDPELPRDEVKEGQAFLTQMERRRMPSRRRGRWWECAKAIMDVRRATGVRVSASRALTAGAGAHVTPRGQGSSHGRGRRSRRSSGWGRYEAVTEGELRAQCGGTRWVMTGGCAGWR
jgi:hypothetical protein